jgi:hypothetical protein
MPVDTRRSPVAADDGCSHRERGDVTPLGDAGDKGLKGRNLLKRAGIIDVMLDGHVDEAHTVLKAEDLVRESLRLAFVQLGEYRLDQPLVFVSPLRLRLIAHHNRLRHVPHFTRPGRIAPTT